MMERPVDPALVQRWLQAQAPGGPVYRWAWFQQAFQDCTAACCARYGYQVEVAMPSLSAAFLEWVRIAEQSASFAALDAVDHAHFLCGSLLSCLLKEAPVRLRPGGEAAAQLGAMPQCWPQGHVVLTFACTLLETYRQQLGAGALHWQQALFDRHWQSFRENVAEEADRAAPFLDFFTGLEPVWEYWASIAQRPAMQRAMAASTPDPLA